LIEPGGSTFAAPFQTLVLGEQSTEANRLRAISAHEFAGCEIESVNLPIQNR
jgi:hypothetical protein